MLDTMVVVRDFFGHFFLENFMQNDGGAPITTTRRRGKLSTRPGIKHHGRCAMSRGSPRMYEWGELPMALQARGTCSLTSVLWPKTREIQRVVCENS
jgi:hypothetical protein